jgi:hypothetical protein
MVHHVQNLAGLGFPCPEASEDTASALQEAWLSHLGQSLAGEFEIDPMTLLVRTTYAW